MDRGGAVVVPWEHWVCSQCLRENPYAVWLIKLRCFQPKIHRHHQYRWTLVSIEPSAMRLVGMRHHPANIEQITAPFPTLPGRAILPKRRFMPTSSFRGGVSHMGIYTDSFSRYLSGSVIFLNKPCICALSLRKHTEKLATKCSSNPPVPNRCLCEVLRQRISILQHTLAHVARMCQTP